MNNYKASVELNHAATDIDTLKATVSALYLKNESAFCCSLTEALAVTTVVFEKFGPNKQCEPFIGTFLLTLLSQYAGITGVSIEKSVQNTDKIIITTTLMLLMGGEN